MDRPESLDGVGEIPRVVPRLADEVGGDDAAAHDQLDVVGGVHVRTQARIVIAFQAHRGGVAVGLVVGLPERPARRLLLLVFEYLQEDLPDRVGESRVAPSRCLGQRLRDRPGRHGNLLGVSRQQPPFAAKREEGARDPLVERGRQPDELVLVRVGLELAAVHEGVVQADAHLRDGGPRDQGEYLPLVRDDDPVDELRDRGIVGPALLHHRDEPDVVGTGVGEFPEGRPSGGETVEHRGEEPVVVDPWTPSLGAFVQHVPVDDGSDAGPFEKTHETEDSFPLLLEGVEGRDQKSPFRDKIGHGRSLLEQVDSTKKRRILVGTGVLL